MTREPQIALASTTLGALPILLLFQLRQRQDDVEAPTADFTTSIDGTTATYDASSSTGTITLYEWDLGDGTTAEGQVVTHDYGQEDVFAVTLTVSGPVGSDTTQKTIAIGDGYGVKGYGSGPYGDPTTAGGTRPVAAHSGVEEFAPAR